MTPLIGVYADGALHFCTGPTERKARNIAADRRSLMSTGANTLHAGTRRRRRGRGAPRHRRRPLRAGRGVGGQVRRGVALRRRRRRLPPRGRRGPRVPVEPARAYAFAKDPYGHTRYTFA